MYQDSFSAGGSTRRWRTPCFSVHYVHNDLRRTIEDIGALDANGDEAYVIGNPGEGSVTARGAERTHAARAADAETEAPVRRARVLR